MGTGRRDMRSHASTGNADGSGPSLALAKRAGLAEARATGVILLAAAEAGLEVEEYGSLEVKMAVTGQGNADKAQVRVALERFHGLKDLPDQRDAVDAAAIALCHLTQARLRKVAAR